MYREDFSQNNIPSHHSKLIVMSLISQTWASSYCIRPWKLLHSYIFLYILHLCSGEKERCLI